MSTRSKGKSLGGKIEAMEIDIPGVSSARKRTTMEIDTPGASSASKRSRAASVAASVRTGRSDMASAQPEHEEIETLLEGIPIKSMTCQILQSHLKRLGIPSAGKKEELLLRLDSHINKCKKVIISPSKSNSTSTKKSVKSSSKIRSPTPELPEEPTPIAVTSTSMAARESPKKTPTSKTCIRGGLKNTPKVHDDNQSTISVSELTVPATKQKQSIAPSKKHPKVIIPKETLEESPITPSSTQQSPWSPQAQAAAMAIGISQAPTDKSERQSRNSSVSEMGNGEKGKGNKKQEEDKRKEDQNGKGKEVEEAVEEEGQEAASDDDEDDEEEEEEEEEGDDDDSSGDADQYSKEVYELLSENDEETPQAAPKPTFSFSFNSVVEGASKIAAAVTPMLPLANAFSNVPLTFNAPFLFSPPLPPPQPMHINPTPSDPVGPFAPVPNQLSHSTNASKIVQQTTSSAPSNLSANTDDLRLKELTDRMLLSIRGIGPSLSVEENTLLKLLLDAATSAPSQALPQQEPPIMPRRLSDVPRSGNAATSFSKQHIPSSNTTSFDFNLGYDRSVTQSLSSSSSVKRWSLSSPGFAPEQPEVKRPVQSFSGLGSNNNSISVNKRRIVENAWGGAMSTPVVNDRAVPTIHASNWNDRAVLSRPSPYTPVFKQNAAKFSSASLIQPTPGRQELKRDLLISSLQRRNSLQAEQTRPFAVTKGPATVANRILTVLNEITSPIEEARRKPVAANWNTAKEPLKVNSLQKTADPYKPPRNMFAAAAPVSTPSVQSASKPDKSAIKPIDQSQEHIEKSLVYGDGEFSFTRPIPIVEELDSYLDENHLEMKYVFSPPSKNSRKSIANAEKAPTPFRKPSENEITDAKKNEKIKPHMASVTATPTSSESSAPKRSIWEMAQNKWKCEVCCVFNENTVDVCLGCDSKKGSKACMGADIEKAQGMAPSEGDKKPFTGFAPAPAATSISASAGIGAGGFSFNAPPSATASASVPPTSAPLTGGFQFGTALVPPPTFDTKKTVDNDLSVPKPPVGFNTSFDVSGSSSVLTKEKESTASLTPFLKPAPEPSKPTLSFPSLPLVPAASPINPFAIATDKAANKPADTLTGKAVVSLPLFGITENKALPTFGPISGSSGSSYMNVSNVIAQTRSEPEKKNEINLPSNSLDTDKPLTSFVGRLSTTTDFGSGSTSSFSFGASSNSVSTAVAPVPSAVTSSEQKPAGSAIAPFSFGASTASAANPATTGFVFGSTSGHELLPSTSAAVVPEVAFQAELTKQTIAALGNRSHLDNGCTVSGTVSSALSVAQPVSSFPTSVPACPPVANPFLSAAPAKDNVPSDPGTPRAQSDSGGSCMQAGDSPMSMMDTGYQSETNSNSNMSNVALPPPMGNISSSQLFPLATSGTSTNIFSPFGTATENAFNPAQNAFSTSGNPFGGGSSSSFEFGGGASNDVKPPSLSLPAFGTSSAAPASNLFNPGGGGMFGTAPVSTPMLFGNPSGSAAATQPFQFGSSSAAPASTSALPSFQFGASPLSTPFQAASAFSLSGTLAGPFGGSAVQPLGVQAGAATFSAGVSSSDAGFSNGNTTARRKVKGKRPGQN